MEILEELRGGIEVEGWAAEKQLENCGFTQWPSACWPGGLILITAVHSKAEN